jgi:hypothetical protein
MAVPVFRALLYMPGAACSPSAKRVLQVLLLIAVMQVATREPVPLPLHERRRALDSKALLVVRAEALFLGRIAV